MPLNSFESEAFRQNEKQIAIAGFCKLEAQAAESQLLLNAQNVLHSSIETFDKFNATILAGQIINWCSRNKIPTERRQAVLDQIFEITPAKPEYFVNSTSEEITMEDLTILLEEEFNFRKQDY